MANKIKPEFSSFEQMFDTVWEESKKNIMETKFNEWKSLNNKIGYCMQDFMSFYEEFKAKYSTEEIYKMIKDNMLNVLQPPTLR